MSRIATALHLTRAAPTKTALALASIRGTTLTAQHAAQAATATPVSFVPVFIVDFPIFRLVEAYSFK
ncbi:hypothetical protein B5K05_23720 [Rhizobium phaseoli]|nr:hypothetical protein B5K04_23655 [Rhizobium phaseoli]RDJ06948.1 hypothetical protein B5K05_23720 [Rhizobium phaseoli]